MSDTLTDFLLAMFDADEAKALRLHADRCGTPSGVTLDSMGRSMDPTCDCDWDIARVLAECESKRRIAAIHETIRAAYPGTTIESDPCCAECSMAGEFPGEFPCRTLKALALPYVDHPDFRPEWRV